MRIAAFLSLLFFPMTISAADVEKAIPPGCRQLVLVTTAGWEAPAATLQRFERPKAGAAWVPVGKPLPALVGERGLAWAAGLLEPPKIGTHKREGDRRAPAGVFRFTTAFGSAEKTTGLKLPVLVVSPTLEAIDDPASRYYNRIVDRAQIAKPDWHSSERMSTIRDYALGLVIAQNPRHVPGAGSCVFFHLWSKKRPGTSGCTILRVADLEVLARWLDATHEPVLVQLPQAEVPPAISASPARGS